MKINTSTIFMNSTHHEASYTSKQSMTMEAAVSKDAAAAILTIASEKEGKSYIESMQDYQKRQKEDETKQRQQNQARAMQQRLDEMRANKAQPFEIRDDVDMKIEMLRRILAALRGERITEPLREYKSCKEPIDLRSDKYKQMDLTSVGLKSFESIEIGEAASLRASIATGNLSVGTGVAGTVWQKITATSGFYTETESTTFATTGMVQTADGRSIDFNVEVSMSRAFTSQYNSLEIQEYIVTDPLMINLDSMVGKISDQKFFFDLDVDGKEENISFAGKGSGFIALDKNGDGKINDGAELFGTQSGDGFKDLAEYDEDKNGWIDENDSIFNKLRIWTKDESGNDYLIDLKSADVGAMYLGNIQTQYSLKNSENKLDAEIKKTGIFLKESTGAVGTMNHVDLVI